MTLGSSTHLGSFDGHHPGRQRDSVGSKEGEEMTDGERKETSGW